MTLPRLRSRTSVHWWRTRTRYRRYGSIHHAVAATNPRSESPAAACAIRRLITASPTAPEVLLGNFSRQFQQYNTPSVVVCAPQELHFRLMLITVLVANEPGFVQLCLRSRYRPDRRYPKRSGDLFQCRQLSLAVSTSSPRRSSLFASDGLNVLTVVFHVPDTRLVSSAKAGADICDGLTTQFIVGKGDRDRCLGLIFGYDPDR